MSTGLAKKGTRAINRAEIVDQNFLEFLEEWDEVVDKTDDLSATVAEPGLSGKAFIELFESQMLSRHLDIEARAMRGRNEGFYTIGSSGHEGNTVVGRVTRHTDPAFLHYRSGGFMMERSRKLESIDPAYDTALSLAASSDDPISGGRHKVWGSLPLWVPPQTSTIASHLPKAVGAAIAIAQAKRLTGEVPVPEESIVVCSFGDASANHATAQAGFNAAGWTSHQNLPCPVLFVCEDNGIGISVQSPAGWIEASFKARPGIKYFTADGLDLLDTWRATREAEDYVRRTRKPAFLHLKLKRLLGHAGTDVETDYRSLEAVESTEAQDPLLLSAETALEEGLMTADEIRTLYESVRERVQAASRKAAERPKLETAEAVMKPLAPYSPEAVNAEATRDDYQESRHEVFGERLPESQPARHLSIQINRAMHDLMAKYREITVFGEDVAQKGGVYTVTAGLYRQFKGHRVFNTLLDETTILGMAQGQAMMGLLPMPEIQYLAYFHNACDQIRGEAASLQFFSNDQYRNPMIMRIAGLAYQKGFGGHFHNDNSFTALRDIPGLVIACPSRGDDAAMMLRTLAALGKVDGRISAFLEPIALYMTKDLYEARDGEWLFPYPEPNRAIPLGEGRVYELNAEDLLIITFGNGVPMSLRAARQIEQESGKRIRVLDLRWLKPLNREFIAQHARDIGRVLVVDESRRTGGLAEEIFTVIEEEAGHGIRKARVCGDDSYIPLGDAANRVLMQESDVLAGARALLAGE
ncbi:thiamine pyrophosphate-dependent enzyme [Natronospira sp.]|uniref:thiamine pyrophosphate-dependent enzyme n=1 Tax=Natronospira sp. TaxID=2024970 RepID=UPI003873A10E